MTNTEVTQVDSASSSSSASMDGGVRHTPGPWHRNIPPAKKYNVVWSGRNTHVAKLADDSRVGAAEAEANINLIAAAPDLFTEHGEWAAMFGEALALALQSDYSKVDELAKSMRLIFPGCTPTLYSAAIAKATA